MSKIMGFFNFWYDFIVGDDWVTAVVVIAALAAVGLLVHAGANAWWLLPLVVIAILGLSLWRLTQGAKKG